jgi:hypothetical protein
MTVPVIETIDRKKQVLGGNLQFAVASLQLGRFRRKRLDVRDEARNASENASLKLAKALGMPFWDIGRALAVPCARANEVSRFFAATRSQGQHLSSTRM